MRVVLVGQTPPPYGGQALMIESTLAGQYEGVELHHVRMAFSRAMGEMGSPGVRKVAHLATVVARILVTRLRTGASVLYYTPGGPERVPMYRDVAILLTSRWMFEATILHFHAGGVSELYPTLHPFLKLLYRKAYHGALVGIRTSDLAPDDPKKLEARHDLVVRNAVPDVAPEYRTGQPRLRDHDDPMILFVGIIRESKGPLVLLEACGELRRRGIPFRAEIVGDFAPAEMEARFWDVARAHEVEDAVVCRGVLTGRDKHQAYASATVLCLPTFFDAEAFPLVLLEAMQFGLPIVSTYWRGIPSVVADGVNGYLVPVRDSQALADRLAALLCDRALARQMGQRGFDLYESQYRLSRFHDDMQEVFELVRREVSR